MGQLTRFIAIFGRTLLLVIVVVGFIGSAASAVLTVFPDSSASKESMLGYESHCSFAPISTIILIVMAAVFGFVFFRKYVRRGSIDETKP